MPQIPRSRKTASAGGISMTTRKTEFERSGNFEVGLGSWNKKSVRGYVTGPLSDTVAYSFGGSSLRRDGYLYNPVLDNEQNERDRWSLRGELLFDVGDEKEMRMMYDYDEMDEICCGTANIINGPAGGAVEALAAIPGNAYDGEEHFSVRS